MFASKLPIFIVLKTRKFLNPSILSSYKFYHNSATLHKRSRSNKNVADSPKCKGYQEKLRECPKPSEALLCCKSLFKKPATNNTCKEQTTFKDYREACEKITSQGKSFLKDVQEKSCSILKEVNSYVEATKKNEEAQMEKLCSGSKAKLSELMSLDVSFGSAKRKCALFFNHRIRQHIQTLRCDLLARIRKLTNMAESIEQDASSCVDRAEVLVRSCRECTNVEALQKCIKEKSDVATAILEEGLKSTQESLKLIDAYKQDIMKYYNAVSAEAIKTYSEENEMFTKYLDDCIYALTGKRK